MSAEYPDLFDAVSEKYEAQGFEALGENDQIVYSIWWLEAEVNNGGFYQYFWNSSGDHAEVALRSLKKIGATKTASLLEQAIEVAFEGQLSGSHFKRQEELEVNEDTKMKELEVLDLEFYEYTEDIIQKVNDYVHK